MSNPDPATPSAGAAPRSAPISSFRCSPARLTIYYLISTVDLVWEAKATGIFIGVVLLALCVAQFVRLGLRIARAQAASASAICSTTTRSTGSASASSLLVAGLYRHDPLGRHDRRAVPPADRLHVADGRAQPAHAARRRAGHRCCSCISLLITLLGSQLPRGLIVEQLCSPLLGGA